MLNLQRACQLIFHILNGLWCLTIFTYMGTVSFIGVGNRGAPEYSTDLPQITDKLYHIMLYRVHLV